MILYKDNCNSIYVCFFDSFYSNSIKYILHLQLELPNFFVTGIL